MFGIGIIIVGGIIYKNSEDILPMINSIITTIWSYFPGSGDATGGGGNNPGMDNISSNSRIAAIFGNGPYQTTTSNISNIVETRFKDPLLGANATASTNPSAQLDIFPSDMDERTPIASTSALPSEATPCQRQSM